MANEYMQKSLQDENTKQQLIFYGTASLVSLCYVLLTFFAPQTSNAFNLGQGQIFFLKFTIAVPYIARWFFAAYGLLALKRYISMAKDEDVAVTKLLRSFQNSIYWFIIGTILIALIGGVKSYFPENTDILPTYTIVTNYLYVFPSLIGFITIYRGVLHLRSSQEMSESKLASYMFNTLIVLFFSGFYIFLIYTNPSRQFSSDPANPATYYLPDLIILLTIVIPTFISWWFGFTSAFLLSDTVPHLVRAASFKGITKILYGIWSIIFSSIIIQSLLSLGSARLYAVGLGFLLLVIYIFIIFEVLGYYFIAHGSNDLRKSLNENNL